MLYLRLLPQDLGGIGGLLVEGHGLGRHTREADLEAVEQCEVPMRVSRGGYALVRSAVDFDRRKQGKRGWCLRAAAKGSVGALPDFPKPTGFRCGAPERKRGHPRDILEALSTDARASPLPALLRGRRLTPEHVATDWLHSCSLGLILLFFNALVWFLID